MKFLVIGSAGPVGNLLVDYLIKEDHIVIGVDDYSKYGSVERSYDSNKNYYFIQADVNSSGILLDMVDGCDYVVLLANESGGSNYGSFVKNEQLFVNVLNSAISVTDNEFFKKLIVVSGASISDFQFSVYTHILNVVAEEFNLVYSLIRLMECNDSDICLNGIDLVDYIYDSIFNGNIDCADVCVNLN